ncbi:MAG TPA: 2Fe-2S iron-sulfur cluster-binding protein [Candidatus Hydrogenedens sp.]|nr:2Fe-2S iron-sulfur cluster-binding protein [Candidatus Hydrogenedens sp.]
MAKIIGYGNEQELPDGSPIIHACEKLGVPFGCRAGQCGTCIITIEDGMENLEPKNFLEEDMGLADNQRLACQTRIRSGIVVISW